jgi:predicted N-acetyltransferase YhbS
MNDATTHALIRPASESDADAIAPLLAALGHPLEPAQIVAQLRALAQQGGNVTLLAERDGCVVGLVSAQALLMLHRAAPVGRITALVVSAELVGGGVGSQLLRAGEAFLESRGCSRIEVTSAPHRTGAHAFYLARGYARQGERFSKEDRIARSSG